MARFFDADEAWPGNTSEAERDAAREFWHGFPSLLTPGGTVADIPKVWAAAFGLDADEVTVLLEPFMERFRARSTRDFPDYCGLRPSALGIATLCAEEATWFLFDGRRRLFGWAVDLPEFQTLSPEWHSRRGRMWAGLKPDTSTGVLRLFAGDVALMSACGAGPVVFGPIEGARREAAAAMLEAHRKLSTQR